MHVSRTTPRASARWLPRFGFTTLALLAHPIAAFAHQGGDPRDLDSCYGKCGAAQGTGGLRCGCDVACAEHGDCCVDRHEWCAPADVQPVCALVDDKKRYSRMCGTDLGFSFVHQGQLEIVFGDSFQYDSDTATRCSDPGVLGNNGVFNDDAQAVFTSGLSRPDWVPGSAAETRPTGATCPHVLSFDRTAPEPPYTFAPLRLRDRDGKDLSLGLLDTPLAAFSEGNTVLALFGRGGADNRHVYVTRRDASDRGLYHVIVDLGTDSHFQNPSAARVRGGDDYETPTDASPSMLYLWGRPRFGSTDQQRVETNGVHLARVPLPIVDVAGGRVRWEPEYYSGLDPATQRPRWTRSESDAAPVFTRDFKTVNQLDVKWIAPLRKWVMLYGGDLPDGGNPAFVSDQPRHGAIHMRSAPHPWGPWSRPTPLLWREHVPWYFQCDAYDDTQPVGCDRKALRAPHYPPGDWQPELTAFRGANCQTSHPKPAQMPNLAFPVPLCLSYAQRGNLYAPNILTPWTRHTPRDAKTRLSTTTLYFAVSTWNPYNVVLAAADLKLPDYAYGDLRLQLRDARARLLRVDRGALGFSRVVSDAASFQIHGPSVMREPAIGDTVAISSVQTGAFITGAALGDTRTPAAEWTLEPADRGAPRGTSVAPGGAAFRLRAATLDGMGAYLTASETGLALQRDPSPNGVFRFGDGCAPGDACAR